MLKANEREAKALAQLRNSDVHAYLMRSYSDVREQLVTQCDVDVLRQQQGEAKALRRLLELVDPESFSTSGKRG